MAYEGITENTSKNAKSLSTITEERTTTTLTTQSSLKCPSKISLPVIEESTKEAIPRLEQKIAREKNKTYKRPVRKFPCYNAVGHRAEPPKQLFGTVTSERRKVVTPKMLVTGFGLRNIESLQDALRLQEENTRLRSLYHTDKTVSIVSVNLQETRKSESSISTEATDVQTESISKSESESAKQAVQYLMGLEVADEEEGETVEMQQIEEVKKKKREFSGTTESMKQAQKYLRVHRIFEFFQFTISHMLSALPGNPVEFIIDLLDKCLVYRAGLVDPPLLYNYKHLECLFHLMDRMDTGFIEVEQYHTGMKTLQIWKYNKTPDLTPDGMVSKAVFIEEAYECLTNMLNDMIRRRWLKTSPPSTTTRSVPPTPAPTLGGSEISDVYSMIDIKSPNRSIFFDTII